MSKALLFRLHRWIAIIFALPLVVVVATGLILSFEPIVATTAIRPGTVTVQTVEGLLRRFDPESRARSLVVRAYENTATLTGARPGGSVRIDLATGEEVQGGGLALSDLFGASRRLHETLMLDAGWLVTGATVAMLVLIALGVLMGWPRLRNTVSGWHKGTGWLALPLVFLSPLTGLLIALGVTFTTAAPQPARSAPVPLMEAVRLVGAGHDLSALVWIRPQGGRMLARINEGGELRVYAVSRDGVAPMPRNWPRLIHEGAFAGVWSGLLNVATSAALVVLLGTGLVLWGRRTFRRRTGGRHARAAAAAA
jgi:uncharacterized iron-regulated membrane protein